MKPNQFAACLVTLLAAALPQTPSNAQTVPAGYTASDYVTGVPGVVTQMAIDPATRTIYFGEQGPALRKVAPDLSISVVTSSILAAGSFYPYAATDLEFYQGGIYTTDSTLDQVVRVDATTGTRTTVGSLSGINSEAGLAVRNGVLYITGGSVGSSLLSITSMDFGTGATAPAMTLPRVASTLEYSRANDRFCFVEYAGVAGLYKVGLSEAVSTVNASTPNSSQSANFAVSPDGTGAFFFSDSNTVSRIDLGSGAVTPFVTGITVPNTYSDVQFGPSSAGPATWSLYVPVSGKILEVAGFTPPDTITQAPTLTLPAASSLVYGSVSVSFSLPESALPGSVKLEWDDGATVTTHTLATSQESSGAHSFTFDPADPTAAAEIASGSALAPGVYTVTLSYQDALGNPAAGDDSANVEVAGAPSVVTQAATGITGIGATLNATVDGNGLASQVSFLIGLSDPPTEETAAFASGTGSEPVSQSSPVLLAESTYYFRVKAVNDAGTTLGDVLSFSTGIEPPEISMLYAEDTAVPNAGTDSRIQTGATWTGFGSPAINDAGEVAYIGKWMAPAVLTPAVLPRQVAVGIFVDDTLVVKAGQAVPGAGSGGLPADATFKSFKDPVLDAGGHVAFLATIKGTGISGTNDNVVVSNGSGALEVLAREGSVAPGTGGATFLGFTAVSIAGTVTGGTIFTASLTVGTGAPAVISNNKTGAWWLPAGESAVLKLVRSGDPGFAVGETIKQFLVLRALGGSPGHGRGQRDADEAIVRLWLIGGVVPRQAQVLATAGVLTELVGTGDALGGTTLPVATWTSMSMASHHGDRLAQFGILKVGIGGVTSVNSKGIFLSEDEGANWEPVARLSQTAPSLGAGITFGSFKDPVNSSDGVAFLGAVRGTGITSANNDSFWWRQDGGALALVGREGSEPSVGPVGAKWKAFTSIALPDGMGPLFTGTLQRGLINQPGPGGITKLDDAGLYAVDSNGHLQQLMRQNQPLVGKTAKAFNVLKAVTGSAGVTRAFNANREVVVHVLFTDDTVGLVKFAIP